MLKFSANLGFLWKELKLTDAIKAAKLAGFDAVECHWPYDIDVSEVRLTLEETNLSMLGINTVRGSETDFGLCALPNRMDEARAAIDQAIAYADAIKTKNIHVMAGVAQGAQAEQTFKNNLNYACEKAGPLGITILIEPINTKDVLGYFLHKTDHAIEIINQLNLPNLKMMFDCYHVEIMEGDTCNRLEACHPYIGHIQIASVPDRAAPDHGILNFDQLLAKLESLNWHSPIGAEYLPSGNSEDSLDWLQRYKAKT